MMARLYRKGAVPAPTFGVREDGVRRLEIRGVIDGEHYTAAVEPGAAAGTWRWWIRFGRQKPRRVGAAPSYLEALDALDLAFRAGGSR